MDIDPLIEAFQRGLAHEVDVDHVAVTGSTNDDLKKLSRTDVIDHPRLLVADRQEAGRGTHGRVWRTPKLSLIFSLALRIPERLVASAPGLLSLAAAMAVAEGSSVISREVVLVKWPNDIWVGSGKAGGILCEVVKDATGSAVLIIGVGLNLEIEPGGRTTAGWPITSIPSRVNLREPAIRGELLALVVNQLVKTFAVLATSRDEMDVLAERWPLFDAFYGKSVVWSSPDNSEETFQGKDCGIDASGRLLIERPNGEYRTLSGELVSLSAFKRQS